MAPRHLLVVALLGVALAGCGGGSSTSASKPDHAVTARWTAGIRSWGSGMSDAIDGISVLFSRPSAVRGIQSGDRRIGRMLDRYERTLAACSERIQRLGDPPASFLLSQREALHACISLERAAKLIRTGISNFQSGLGYESLDASGDPLTAGQDGVRRAQLDLPAR